MDVKTASDNSSYLFLSQALLKIIIQQRETIQTQLGNLKAKDLYLKTLDKSLSCSDGREYVLRNYLEQIPEHVEVGILIRNNFQTVCMKYFQ